MAIVDSNRELGKCVSSRTQSCTLLIAKDNLPAHSPQCFVLNSQIHLSRSCQNLNHAFCRISRMWSIRYSALLYLFHVLIKGYKLDMNLCCRS